MKYSVLCTLSISTRASLSWTQHFSICFSVYAVCFSRIKLWGWNFNINCCKAGFGIEPNAMRQNQIEHGLKTNHTDRKTNWKKNHAQIESVLVENAVQIEKCRAQIDSNWPCARSKCRFQEIRKTRKQNKKWHVQIDKSRVKMKKSWSICFFNRDRATRQ